MPMSIRKCRGSCSSGTRSSRATGRPGIEDDGVTVHVRLDVLARLGGADFGWQVPALREELVTALIRSLPKELRRNFVPAPDTARAVLAELTPGREPLLDGVQRELYR